MPESVAPAPAPLWRVTIWHPQLRRPFRVFLEVDEVGPEVAAWVQRGAQLLEVRDGEGRVVTEEFSSF